MKSALLRLEFRRLQRDPVTILIVVVLPVVFFLGFTLAVPVASMPGANSELLRAGLMVGMAAYGAATAATSIAGQAAVDRIQGWGRQLALTPLRDRDYVLVKALVAVGAGVAPTLAVFTTGAVTGIALSPLAWVLSGLLVVAGAAIWALYGLAVGLAGRSQSATAAASAGLVVLAFAGDVFLPLSGVLQQIGRLSPMYGHVQLARWPVDGGAPVVAGQMADPWWMILANIIVWAALFTVVAVREVKRSRERR